MKTKVSPAVIGAFVIGGFALLFVALMAFGGVSFFSKPPRFVVLFNESIQGLNLSSPVKLRGVWVGKVVDLNIRYDERSNRSVVAVVCEFSKDAMTDATGTGINVAGREELQAMVDRGLRAQLGVLGLATGLLYVELDIVNPEEFPADKNAADPRYVIVPALPSAISAFQASASEILSKIRKIDFAGLSEEIKSLVAQTRKQVAGIDVRGVVDQWKKTGMAVESLANRPEIKQTFENLNATMADLRAAIARLDAHVDPAGKDLAATLLEARRAMQAFADAATAARGFVTSNVGVGADLGVTLGRLNEAAEAVARLAEYLERNPNALLTGKKRPE